MALKHCIYLLTSFVFFLSSFAQPDTVPAGYFCSPLDIPLTTSGMFAEPRSNHFHSGIDFRVGGVIGKPVYAVAGGYVSRIKVSAYGGGKTVYISHPNGYKSVYMHLHNFSGAVAHFVTRYQTKHRTFEMDVAIPSDSLPVLQRQHIGNAGNSGGSQGPHLHFELRYDHNDETIHPLLFGFDFLDRVPPTIHNIRLYPAHERTLIQGKNQPFAWMENKTVKKKKNQKTITVRNDTIRVAGKFYTGIYATDASNNSVGRNGISRIRLFVDDSLWYSYHPTSFLFEETRAVNSMIDYSMYKTSRAPYLLSRVLKGNRSGVCKAYKDNGYIHFYDTGVHKITYRVWDFSGNKKEVSFFVMSDTVQGPPKQNPARNESVYSIPISYYKQNKYEKGDFSVSFRPFTFYENDRMQHQKSASQYPSILSDVHTIRFQQYHFPPHQAYTMKLVIPEPLRSFRNKLVLVSVAGNKIDAQPFHLEGDTLVGSLRIFGSFSMAMDTVPPSVTALNFSEKKKCPASELRWKVSDNLSGIVSYHCYINGEWVLSEHDGKTATLSVYASPWLRTGENTVEMIVSDKVGNTAAKQWKVHR